MYNYTGINRLVDLCMILVFSIIIVYMTEKAADGMNENTHTVRMICKRARVLAETRYYESDCLKRCNEICSRAYEIAKSPYARKLARDAREYCRKRIEMQTGTK